MEPEAFSKDVADKGYMFINYHSAGKLTETKVSANLAERRIYMDVERFRSYSSNNQYAGNSIAPKKINHRFANMNNIRNYFGERLDEHMFIAGFAMEDEVVYFGSYDGYLYAIFQDGTLKGKYLTNEIHRSSPAIGQDSPVPRYLCSILIPISWAPRSSTDS